MNDSYPPSYVSSLSSAAGLTLLVLLFIGFSRGTDLVSMLLEHPPSLPPLPVKPTSKDAALVYFGTVGAKNYDEKEAMLGKGGWTLDAAIGAHPYIDRYVLSFNQERGWNFTTFLHSWNSELEGPIEALLRPNRSSYGPQTLWGEHVEQRRGGMAATLELALRHLEEYTTEVRGGTPFARVVILRFDSVFYRPFDLDALVEDDALYVASWCAAQRASSPPKPPGALHCWNLSTYWADNEGVPDFWFAGAQTPVLRTFSHLFAGVLSGAVVKGRTCSGCGHGLVWGALNARRVKVRRYLYHQVDNDLFRDVSTAGAAREESLANGLAYGSQEGGRVSESPGGPDSLCKNMVYCVFKEQEMHGPVPSQEGMKDDRRDHGPHPPYPLGAPRLAEPASPCTCKSKDDRLGSESRFTVHIVGADVVDGVSQGVQKFGSSGSFSYTGLFGFSHVVDVRSSGAEGVRQRSVTVTRLSGWDSYELSGMEGELTQSSAAALSMLTSDFVPQQDCHFSPGPPSFYYIEGIDGESESLGDWLGLSAIFLNPQRFEALRAQYPTLRLLLNSIVPYKLATLQLYNVEEKDITVSSLRQPPCDGGNRVFFPPLPSNLNGGWSLTWLKRDHLENLLGDWREKSGLPRHCPLPCAPSSSCVLGKAVLLKVPKSEEDLWETQGTWNPLFQVLMTDAIKKMGGEILTFPDSPDLKLSGIEMKDFIRSVGTAQVVISQAHSASWILAGLARSATLIFTQDTHTLDLMTSPGKLMEQQVASRNNVVHTLVVGSGNDSDMKGAVGLATSILQEVLSGPPALIPCSPPQ